MGFLFARNPNLDTTGQCKMYNTRVNGKFKYACIYNLGAEESHYTGVQLRNAYVDEGNSITSVVKVVWANLDNITSPCSTPSGSSSCVAPIIDGNSSIVYTGGGSGSAVYIGDGPVNNFVIRDSYLNSNGLCKILFKNTLTTGNLYGPYAFENIHCEGASLYSIYGYVNALHYLRLINYVDFCHTNNGIQIVGAPGSLYYAYIDKPQFAGGTFQKVHAAYSIISSYIIGTPGDLLYVEAGHDIRASHIELPNIANATAGNQIEGTRLISSHQSLDAHVSYGARTTLGIGKSTGIYVDKTIASGTLAVSQSITRIRPESGTTDDLVTITGLNDGDILVLFPKTANDVITVKHGTGNIYLSGGIDVALSNVNDSLVFVYCGGACVELCRSIKH